MTDKTNSTYRAKYGRDDTGHCRNCGQRGLHSYECMADQAEERIEQLNTENKRLREELAAIRSLAQRIDTEGDEVDYIELLREIAGR